MKKLWANSGDSHFIEPPDLWKEILPPHLAQRMPWMERLADDEEIIHVDGKSIRHRMPKIHTKRDASGNTQWELSNRPPGARNLQLRMQDLDAEGIWGEVVYSSLGLYETLIDDRALVRTSSRAENEWKVSEVQGLAPDRLVPAASIPLLDIQDAVTELLAAAKMGLHLVSLPCGTPQAMPDWHREDWEPLWTAAEESRVVLGFHIGDSERSPVVYNGLGGAVMNYVETSFSGQQVTMKLVSSGVLDRHPDLKVLISEGGATWVPQLGDRMNEGYRQHHMWVRPQLSRLPKEILYSQVYASFQHDETAPAAMWAMGYPNVMWGSDYPHMEGTYGHSQDTLHSLFDNVDPAISHRIRIGAFRDLFPHVSDPPSD